MACYDQVNFSPLKITSLEDLPNKEAANKIADAFSFISQKYSPLKVEDLPAFLPAQKPPCIQSYQIHEMIQSTKKTKSTLEGDLPHSIIKEFSVELSDPLANIFNKCLQSYEYPSQWKLECVTPVPKAYPTETTNDVRKISGTPFFSTLFERFLGANFMLHLMVE